MLTMHLSTYILTKAITKLSLAESSQVKYWKFKIIHLILFQIWIANSSLSLNYITCLKIVSSFFAK